MAMTLTLATIGGNIISDIDLQQQQHQEQQQCADLAENDSASASSQLRICLMVEPSPFTYVSGYANRFQELIRFLIQCNDTVEVITCDESYPPKQHLTDWNGVVAVHHTRGVGLPLYRNVTLSIDWTWKIFRVLRRFKPHILHVSSPGIMVLPAIFWSRLWSFPLLLSYHTHLPVYLARYIHPSMVPLAWWWIKWTHSWADLTVVTSPPIQQEFSDHSIPNVDLWQKAVDTERFHPQHFDTTMRHKMTNGHPKRFILLYVGRLATEKRVEDLVGILETCPLSTTCLCLVGMGPEETKLRALFHNSTRSVVFLGELYGVELSQAFASADVFVFPSDSETLGFVVLEAMASGTPVVAARAGGVPSLIDHGSTSFLVKTGDIDEFVHYIELLHHDKRLRSEIGKKARSEAERWSWGASMSHLRHYQYPKAIQIFSKRTRKSNFGD